MTLEQFTHLLEVHGSDFRRWPDELRTGARTFASTDATATELLRQYEQLDRLLDRLPVPEFAGLEARVLRQPLPPRHRSIPDRLIAWLLPAEGFGPQLWRPTVAACLPLVFGIVLGNFYSFGVGAQVDEFEYWENELTLLSLTDYSENGF